MARINVERCQVHIRDSEGEMEDIKKWTAQRQRSNCGGGCLAVAVADWWQRGGQRGGSTAVATAFLQLGSGGGSAAAAAAVAAVRWWW